MKSSASTVEVRRVVLAVSTLEDRCDALEVAVEFAAQFKAELAALLVDDINLLKLAELPFAKEMDSFSGAIRPLDPMRLSGALASNAEKLKRHLDEASRRRKVALTIRVVRGHFLTMAREAAEARDILVLNQTSRGRSKEVRARTSTYGGAPIWVYFDDSPGTRRGLALAISLVQGTKRQLVVLLDKDANRETVWNELARARDTPGERISGVLNARDTGAMEDTLRTRGYAVLILPREMVDAEREPGTLGMISGPRILA